MKTTFAIAVLLGLASANVASFDADTEMQRKPNKKHLLAENIETEMQQVKKDIKVGDEGKVAREINKVLEKIGKTTDRLQKFNKENGKAIEKQIQKLEEDLKTAKRNAKLNHDEFEKSVQNAINNVKVTDTNGWTKIEFANPQSVVNSFQKTAADIERRDQAVKASIKRQIAWWKAEAKKFHNQTGLVQTGIETPVSLATVKIDNQQVAAAAAEAEALQKAFEQFAQQKNLEGQFAQWAETSGWGRRADSLGEKYRTGIQKLADDNNVEGWINQNRVDARIQNIVQELQTSVTQSPRSDNNFTYLDIDENKVN